jgi:uncharacterized protein YbjT (DUF2867 family)
MYVVTGTTGNTGSVVASRLLAAGKQVRGIGRSAERLQPLAQKGLEPFLAPLTDSELLTKAFQGAEAVYLMIPPAYAEHDLRAHQRAVVEAYGTAIEQAGVTHAVVLSSIGAERPEGTGPIVGLYLLEQRLNHIQRLNALYLRCGNFMENTLMQAGMIHKMGKLADSLQPDLRLPMIASRDIGEAAADELIRLGFTGKQTRELLGPGEISMTDVAAIIGKAIGKPDLKYAQISDEQARAGMHEMGLSVDLTNQLLELAHAVNTGLIRPREARCSENTTPTSFVSFVREQFVPQYKGRVAA